MELLTITDVAQEKLQNLLSARDPKPLGIRICLKTKGCSGLSYALEYADEKQDLDEVLNFDWGTVYVDPKAVMFLIGTIMDFEEKILESGFVFNNPNEKGRCGCGKSFHV